MLYVILNKRQWNFAMHVDVRYTTVDQNVCLQVISYVWAMEVPQHTSAYATTQKDIRMWSSNVVTITLSTALVLAK